VIFYIWDGLGYGFGLGTYILVTCPTPMFWNRGKPNPIPKPSQNEENLSNWVWYGWVTAGMGFVAIPSCWHYLCFTFSDSFVPILDYIGAILLVWTTRGFYPYIEGFFTLKYWCSLVSFNCFHCFHLFLFSS